MAEQEWLDSSDPARLLELVRSTIHARKLRLFAVACCRRIYHILTDPRSRELVDLAEQIADDGSARDRAGPIVDRAREVAYKAFGPLTGMMEELEGLMINDQAACVVVFFLIWRMENEAFRNTFAVMRYTASRFPGDGETQQQCILLRCVVGNYFLPVTIDPTWLTPTVQSLAESIYTDRAFDRLPILADALEEAGCHQPDILNHCRQPGDHVRGCWALDLVLGKE
jgi:hypothetical protein